MKLIITIATVIVVFTASLAESGALFLCYLCAENNSCQPNAETVKEPASKASCKSCYEERATACGPLKIIAPPPKPDSSKRVCNFVIFADGKIRHQCKIPWQPPLLISTLALKDTITPGLKLTLNRIDTFSGLPNRSRSIIPLYITENIHQTIASTILRC